MNDGELLTLLSCTLQLQMEELMAQQPQST